MSYKFKTGSMSVKTEDGFKDIGILVGASGGVDSEELATIKQEQGTIKESLKDKVGWAKVTDNTLYLYADEAMTTLIQTVTLPSSSGGTADGNTTYTFSISGNVITITDSNGIRQTITVPSGIDELPDNIVYFSDTSDDNEELAIPVNSANGTTFYIGVGDDGKPFVGNTSNEVVWTPADAVYENGDEVSY